MTEGKSNGLILSYIGILKELQELICDWLEKMLFSNPNCIKYHERYQEIIEDNNQQDCANIERTFDELMKLVQSMEQKG